MSHYAVAVFHREDQSIDELLAPYDENIEMEPYVRKTREEFISDGWEERNDYIHHLKQDPAYYCGLNMDDYAAATSDEEIYLAATKYYEEGSLDEDGNYWSTYNPNSKWDWWVEGGRFSGMLLLKSEAVDPEFPDYNTCDSAPIKDIDFSINQAAYDKALRFWDVVIDGAPLEDGEEEPFTFYKKEYFTEYYKDRIDYATRCAQWSTFAVVTPDGVWHEPGKMGWFGCANTTAESERDWYMHYYERFIDGQDPDLILTIVDCHI